jgi:hypothetical protein
MIILFTVSGMVAFASLRILAILMNVESNKWNPDKRSGVK